MANNDYFENMVQNKIVDQFLTGLKERLSPEDLTQLSYTSGATATQLESLKKAFPDCPESLLYLLSQINGTYWEEYGDNTVTLLMLGSDVDDYTYPYYLKSVEQILTENNNQESIRSMYGDDLEEYPEIAGEGIDPDANTSNWLCFSDCMNNGGTSRLYIDFHPLPTGTKGQIVRFLHDPDSYEVIAPSFDAYLQLLITKDYAFVQPEE